MGFLFSNYESWYKLMTKNEVIASILLEAAELLKNDNEQESLNEGIIGKIKERYNKYIKEKQDKKCTDEQEAKKKSEYNKLWEEMLKVTDELEKEVISEINKIEMPSHDLKDVNNKEIVKYFKDDLKYLIKKINSNSVIISKCRKIAEKYSEPYNKVYGSDYVEHFTKFMCNEFESDSFEIITDGQDVACALCSIIGTIGEKVNKNLNNRLNIGTGDGDEGCIYI